MVGAAVSYSQLEPWAQQYSKPLHQLLLRLGSRQIRNNGTVGGNLANGSPIADMPPILIAWDAQLEVVAATGLSRLSLVEDFYIGYRQTTLADDEYIARIRIPRASVERFHRFYKSSKRIEDDISSVMGAFSFELEDDRVSFARIAYGGMAATPVRLTELEQALIGQPVTEAVITETMALVQQHLTPMTDVRASAAYRSDMAAVMLKRALLELNGQLLDERARARG